MSYRARRCCNSPSACVCVCVVFCLLWCDLFEVSIGHNSRLANATHRCSRSCSCPGASQARGGVGNQGLHMHMTLPRCHTLNTCVCVCVCTTNIINAEQAETTVAHRSDATAAAQWSNMLMFGRQMQIIKEELVEARAHYSHFTL